MTTPFEDDDDGSRCPLSEFSSDVERGARSRSPRRSRPPPEIAPVRLVCDNCDRSSDTCPNIRKFFFDAEDEEMYVFRCPLCRDLVELSTMIKRMNFFIRGPTRAMIEHAVTNITMLVRFVHNFVFEDITDPVLLASGITSVGAHHMDRHYGDVESVD